MTTASIDIPGYVAGTWTIDPVHTDISFTVRHLMVSKVRGKFTRFEGQIITGQDLSDLSVTASIDLDSIDTGDPNRDAHIRSSDFFDVEKHQKMTYRSTGVRPDGDGFVVDGELTLHGVTRPVPLKVEVNGFVANTPMGTRAGFSATTELSRKDFGIEFNMPLEGGGVVIGDKIQIHIEVEAILQEDAA